MNEQNKVYERQVMRFMNNKNKVYEQQEKVYE